METASQQNINWRVDILPPETKRALDFLSKAPWLSDKKWYLAGGTALALYAGHRQSLDLDFFTQQKSFSARSFMLNITDEARWRIEIAEDGRVHGTVLGAKVSFISYPFFLKKKPFNHYGVVQVLAPEDIAVMKIIAISQRGTKRDFIDLYWYASNKESLAAVLKRLPEQYPTVAHDYHHILKSLVYFEDADGEPMPHLFFHADWDTVRLYFKTEVPHIAKEIIGLNDTR